MDNTILIQTKYYGSTNYKGSRIKAMVVDPIKASNTIGYPHELNNHDAHRKAAQTLVDKLGLHGELAGSYVVGNTHSHIFYRQ